MTESPNEPPAWAPGDLPDAAAPVEKPVEDWVTGDEPATAAQRSYVETLAREAGAEVPDRLSKADASRLIEDLRQRSPRMRQAPPGD
jgi:diphthamide synthase (EF-2-diphthine--ammonia ligase)